MRHHRRNKNVKKGSLSDRNLDELGLKWKDLNHSVLIIGWGIDKKTKEKYWIARNSFGRDFGMDGDFYVRRGENDFGIETETTAYESVLCD